MIGFFVLCFFVEHDILPLLERGSMRHKRETRCVGSVSEELPFGRVLCRSLSRIFAFVLLLRGHLCLAGSLCDGLYNQANIAGREVHGMTTQLECDASLRRVKM